MSRLWWLTREYGRAKSSLIRRWRCLVSRALPLYNNNDPCLPCVPCVRVGGPLAARQPPRFGVLLLLLLMLLAAAPLGARAQRACPVSALKLSKDYWIENAGGKAAVHKCSDPTPHGVRCALTETYCLRQFNDAIALDLECVDGQWRWADDARFCASWGDCTWDPIWRTIVCDVSSVAEGVGAQRFPKAMDASLTHISLYGAREFKSITRTQQLPELRYLNVSYSSVDHIYRDALVGLSRLEALDLSHNNLTRFSSYALPVAGTLNTLLLNGNPIREMSAMSLSAALMPCTLPTPQTPGEADGADSNGGSSTTSTTVFAIDGDVCRLVPDSRRRIALPPTAVCIQASCEAAVSAQPPQALCRPGGTVTKQGVASLTAQTIPAHRLCDGVSDCAGGTDEALCAGDLAIQEAISKDSNYLCQQFISGFGHSFAIRNGMLQFPISNPLFDTTALFLPYSATFDFRFRFRVEDELATYFINAVDGHTTIDNNGVFHVNFNISLRGSNSTDATPCFYIFPSANISQAVPWVGASTQNNGAGLVVPLAAGVSVLVVVMAVGLVLLYRQGRTTRLLQQKLSHGVQVTPPDCLLSVSLLRIVMYGYESSCVMYRHVQALGIPPALASS